jgi:peptidoglycan hydrolase-like protein with peptidoglycan-binding domain
MMVDLQLRLTAKGYDAGPAIGRLTEKTKTALTAFQQANGLATGGITYETLTALGMPTP